MEVRALAEAVLYGTTLEDKLAGHGLRPDDWTDARPGAALSVLPDAPGRPAGLGFADTVGKTAFPKPSALAGDTARGIALHFFANHELLAMELMALLLLRFPDAPQDFRLDLARTIAEEQDHLRLYQDRMHALGVELGAVPVNAFFWRLMRDVPTPLDFVVRMALTFEQANLDYCRHYGDKFRAAGDDVSADLLQTVYDDEIGHVRHGVAWFNRWREGTEDDWAAYLSMLPDELSAVRAKGPVYDAEARRRAGLSETYVRELSLFSASKGRPPTRFVFDPTCEDAWAPGPTRPATPAVQALVRDLAPLFGFVALPDDQLVLDRPVRLAHREALAQVGLTCPEVVTPRGPEASDAARRPGRLAPWGLTPAWADEAERITGTRPDPGPVGRWTDKRASRRALRDLLAELGADPVLGPAEHLVGVEATTLAEVEAAGLRIAELGVPAVVKSAFSASGRRRVRSGPDGRLSEADRGFVARTLRQEGSVWVAPWLDRVRDFGLVLDVGPGRNREGDLLWLENDPAGAYRGHVLAPPETDLPADLRRRLNRDRSWRARILAIGSFVQDRLRADGYLGPVGVDLFLYRDPTDPAQVRLHPLVELNPRYTMGHVARAVRRAVAPKHVGVLRQIPRRALASYGAADFPSFAAERAAATPATVVRQRLARGVLCLTDPSQAEQVLAVLSVGARLDDARRGLDQPA